MDLTTITAINPTFWKSRVYAPTNRLDRIDYSTFGCHDVHFFIFNLLTDYFSEIGLYLIAAESAVYRTQLEIIN